MELIMHFWCELAVSIGVAVVVYGGLGLFLRRVHDDSELEYELSAVQPMPDEDVPLSEDNALDFLREAVRLAEERLKAQREQARALERNAILLGAFCVFTFAFLLTGEFDTLGALPTKWVAMVFLVMATALCARAIDFYHYGAAGLYAPDLNEYIQDPRPEDHAHLLRCVLAEYYTSIPFNEQSNNQKITRLNRANNCWVFGISAALGVFAGNSTPIEYLCNWLIG